MLSVDQQLDCTQIVITSRLWRVLEAKIWKNFFILSKLNVLWSQHLPIIMRWKFWIKNFLPILFKTECLRSWFHRNCLLRHCFYILKKCGHILNEFPWRFRLKVDLLAQLRTTCEESLRCRIIPTQYTLFYFFSEVSNSAGKV